MAMNTFRMCGDMSHICGIVLLVLRLLFTRNAHGISARVHELYLLVFVTRYLDLFTTFYSVYNSLMKIFYLASTALIIYMIRYQASVKATYDKEQDSFVSWWHAVTPCAALALLTHLFGSGIYFFNLLELHWTFSIYLEVLAILPQLTMLQRYREVQNLTDNYVLFMGVYIFLMGAYRGLYIINWIYRAHTEKNYRHHWLVYICGVVQTLLHAYLFYYFIKSAKGGKFALPPPILESERERGQNDLEEALLNQPEVKGPGGNETNFVFVTFNPTAPDWHLQLGPTVGQETTKRSLDTQVV